MPDHSQYGWYDFTRSFLDLVELGCKEVKEQKHKKNIGGIEIKYEKSLNIAIIYNMKHAIEIFIKTLIRYAEYDSFQNIKEHNLEFLFNLYVEKFERLKKKPKYSLKNAHPATQEYVKNFDKNALKLAEVIDYYDQLKFLNKEDISVIDTKNTAFKYPENYLEINAQIDYYNFLNAKLDADKIIKDVMIIKDHLNSILCVFKFFHLGY